MYIGVSQTLNTYEYLMFNPKTLSLYWSDIKTEDGSDEITFVNRVVDKATRLPLMYNPYIDYTVYAVLNGNSQRLEIEAGKTAERQEWGTNTFVIPNQDKLIKSAKEMYKRLTAFKEVGFSDIMTIIDKLWQTKLFGACKNLVIIQIAIALNISVYFYSTNKSLWDNSLDAVLADKDIGIDFDLLRDSLNFKIAIYNGKGWNKGFLITNAKPSDRNVRGEISGYPIYDLSECRGRVPEENIFGFTKVSTVPARSNYYGNTVIYPDDLKDLSLACMYHKYKTNINYVYIGKSSKGVGYIWRSGWRSGLNVRALKHIVVRSPVYQSEKLIKWAIMHNITLWVMKDCAFYEKLKEHKQIVPTEAEWLSLCTVLDIQDPPELLDGNIGGTEEAVRYGVLESSLGDYQMYIDSIKYSYTKGAEAALGKIRKGFKVTDREIIIAFGLFRHVLPRTVKHWVKAGFTCNDLLCIIKQLENPTVQSDDIVANFAEHTTWEYTRNYFVSSSECDFIYNIMLIGRNEELKPMQDELACFYQNLVYRYYIKCTENQSE